MNMDLERIITDEVQDAELSLAGEMAYLADLDRRPVYHDGTPRKSWDELGDLEQSSWR